MALYPFGSIGGVGGMLGGMLGGGAGLVPRLPAGMGDVGGAGKTDPSGTLWFTGAKGDPGSPEAQQAAMQGLQTPAPGGSPWDAALQRGLQMGSQLFPGIDPTRPASDVLAGPNAYQGGQWFNPGGQPPPQGPWTPWWGGGQAGAPMGQPQMRGPWIGPQLPMLLSRFAQGGWPGLSGGPMPGDPNRLVNNGWGQMIPAWRAEEMRRNGAIA